MKELTERLRDMADREGRHSYSPGINPYYLVFLKCGGGTNYDYIEWINANHRAFRKLYAVPEGPYSEAVREQFGRWLAT